MKQFYLYDENKIFKGVELRSPQLIQVGDEIQEYEFTDGTFIAPPDGLYKAQFDGEQWIETITEKELSELTKIETLLPTNEERIDALEGAMIEIFETLS